MASDQDLDFLIISKDFDEIDELKTFLNNLLSCECKGLDAQHTIRAYDARAMILGSYFVMTGTLYRCTGADFDYWCKKEHKEHLLKSVVYLEENNNGTGIRHYAFNNMNVFDIKDIHILDNPVATLKELMQDYNLDQEVSQFICLYFYNKRAWLNDLNGERGCNECEKRNTCECYQNQRFHCDECTELDENDDNDDDNDTGNTLTLH